MLLSAVVAVSLVGAVSSAEASVGAPSWWSGDCDASHWNSVASSKGWSGAGAHRLGASYLGVPVCGPRPGGDGAPDVTWSRSGWGHYEWECTELAFRFMAQVYGVTAYGANGVDVVNNYRTSYGGSLVVVNNATAGTPPLPGDVMSFRNGNAAGHVAVVSTSAVDQNGNGSIGLITQNDTSDGTRTLAVSGWRVASFGTYVPYGWLHDPAGRGDPGASGGGQDKVSDGAFVRVTGHSEVYRVAGGAPTYVSSWSSFGGQQPVRDLTPTQFGALRRVPADDTFVAGASTGQVYVVAGGAPLRRSECDASSACSPVTTVDQAAIANAGTGGFWDHLSGTPADGTTISAQDTGKTYKVAGGAPVLVTTCDLGCATPVEVNQSIVDGAGGAGVNRYLLKIPVDGTVLKGTPSNRIWRMAGGCRLAATSTGAIGVSDEGVNAITQCAARPAIAQRSSGGDVTITISADPRFAGLRAFIYRRSGITGQVVALGTATLASSGVGTREFRTATGQHLLLYAKLVGATQIESPYTRDVAFVVS